MFRQLFNRNKIESTKSEVNSDFSKQPDDEKNSNQLTKK